jgi:hypothetical protein
MGQWEEVLDENRVTDNNPINHCPGPGDKFRQEFQSLGPFSLPLDKDQMFG